MKCEVKAKLFGHAAMGAQRHKLSCNMHLILREKCYCARAGAFAYQKCISTISEAPGNCCPPWNDRLSFNNAACSRHVRYTFSLLIIISRCKILTRLKGDQLAHLMTFPFIFLRMERHSLSENTLDSTSFILLIKRAEIAIWQTKSLAIAENLCYCKGFYFWFIPEWGLKIDLK